MEDVNQNGIPDKYDRIIGGFVMLVDAVFSAFVSATAADYEWAPWVHGVQAVMPVLAGWFVLRGRPKVAPTACLLALVLALSSCSGAGWRATAAVRSAGKLTDQAIAMSVRQAAVKCERDKAPDIPRCVRSSKAWEAQTQWRKYGVRAVNSGIIATVTALQIADQTKSKVDWMAILKPAACALASVVHQWGDQLGKAKTTVLAAVSALKGVSCK